MRRFAAMFCLQGLNYLLVSANIRALAQGRVGETAGTDLLIGLVSFLLIKRVAEAKGKVELAGYMLGGTAGSVLAIYITQQLFGA